jgi:acetolactate synthase I/II/III large subunit
MNTSDYILDFFEKKGVKRVFLITGGAIAFLVDSFSRNKKIKYTCVAHEQAAAMMADAYSRIGPGLSLTMATSGPGATNLITGIACSWFDSIPSIHITGQVPTMELSNYSKSTVNVRQVGFQETDIVSICKPITKFSYQIKDKSELKFILEKAVYISQSGRPGPVVIDIPMNIQKEEYNPKIYKSFVIKKEKIKKINFLKIEQELNKSKKPMIILGGGIRYSKSEKILEKFLSKNKVPIVSTWSGKDLISNNFQMNMGSIGVYGSRAANLMIQNSDFIINLGSRLDTRVTGGRPSTFARNAKIISVDIDKNELNKERGLKLYKKINCDLNYFLKIAINKINFTNKNKINDWIINCKNLKKKFPINENMNKSTKKVCPYKFIKILSDLLKKDDIIIPDDGAHLTWAMQAFKVKKGQRLFSAFGNSPMGYAFPAAIGAALTYKKKKRIICIDGDGSIQINIQELQTAKFNNLPIKIFIFNNEGYGIIKQFQDLYLGKRHEATISKKGVSNPNFKKIANAYGIEYTSIKNNKESEVKLRKILKKNRLEIIEVFLEKEQKIVPKLEYGRPIEDLSPLLDRKLFSKIMGSNQIQTKKSLEVN